MALLDVTDVLLDPDFADYDLQCERTQLEIGEDGVARKTSELTQFTGVVTPDTGETLERSGEGERIKGRITIHTKFALIDSAAGGTADIVHWKSNRYTVSNVSSNLHFGQGFVRASCDIIPKAGVLNG